jgi:hypothetical protein
MRYRKPPRREPLPYEVRNLNHRPPVTRRDFLARGMLASSATLFGGSLLGMLAKPRTAQAQAPLQLPADIAALVTNPCNIHAGAGKLPFIIFDLSGGANLVGSEFLVGQSGGQLDFLSTAGYNIQGLPGNMIPNSSAGVGSFINSSLGIAMHSDSAILRGIQAFASASTMANVNGAVFPVISNTDTNINPLNPIFGLNTATGAAGALLALIGDQATTSGGNSAAPAYMVNQNLLPTVITQPSDLIGLVSTGQLVGVLNQADAVQVLSSMERITAMKLGQVNTLIPSQDTTLKNIVQCSYVDSAYLVANYGDAVQTLNPTLDTKLTSILTATDLQDPEFLTAATVAKAIVNGYAGVATVEMGGYDYHDGTRATGEGRNFKVGQCIGAIMQYASLVGYPVGFLLISDGSLENSNGMADTSAAGRDKLVWTNDQSTTAAGAMLVFDPKGRPAMTSNGNQIGSYNANGSVNSTSSIVASAPNLFAEAVVLNYMALHGQAGQFQSVVWAGGVPQGLGSAATYQSLIAFEQLPSVNSSGVIPGL